MPQEVTTEIFAAATDAWIGLGGVVIGAAVSALGVWLTNKSSLVQLQVQLSHERDSNFEDVKRAKLEELYTQVGHWLGGMGSHYMTLTMVMHGKIDYNQYLEIILESKGRQNYDFQRLEMIIDIYASDLKTHYDNVINAREELNEVAGQFKHDYEQGRTNGEKYLKSYVVAQNKIEALGNVLKEKISENAKNV
jgi:flagellar biosynthesis chaperone FliJ